MALVRKTEFGTVDIKKMFPVNQFQVLTNPSQSLGYTGRLLTVYQEMKEMYSNAGWIIKNEKPDAFEFSIERTTMVEE